MLMRKRVPRLSQFVLSTGSEGVNTMLPYHDYMLATGDVAGTVKVCQHENTYDKVHRCVDLGYPSAHSGDGVLGQRGLHLRLRHRRQQQVSHGNKVRILQRLHVLMLMHSCSCL